MQKLGRKAINIGIPILIGILLVVYSYSRFSPEQLGEIRLHFEQANYSFVALSVVFSLLSHIVRAHRWTFLARPLGFKPKLYNSFMALNCAYLLNLAIPRAGEVTRAILIDKYEGISFQKSFGTIIAERVVDLFFLLGFSIVVLLIKAEVLFEYFMEIIPFKKLSSIAILGFVGLLLAWLLLRYTKGKFVQKIKSFLRGIKEGVWSISKMKNKGEFLFYSCLIWALYVAAFYVGIFAFEQTSAIAFSSMLLAFVAGSFAISFTNSGFGSYPLFVAGVLGLFGIAETSGTAFGWIIWTSNLASILVLGIASFILLPLINQKRPHKN